MRTRPRASLVRAALCAAPFIATLPAALAAQTSTAWRQHDPDRPRPAIVTPGTMPGAAPSDAVILFDGSSLAAWRGREGAAPAQWVVRDGYMEAAPGVGAIQTAAPLGDIQLHIEWATPTPPKGRGQGRGNSGVILMGRYEVQVLDSYDNATYADGQAGALYGQYPPLVNAARRPGEWQVYDIVFRGPRWNATGTLTRPARVTVFHNGVLVQDHASLWGGTAWLRPAPYEPHAARAPLVLQDHSNPVRYRNIWVRALPDEPAMAPRAGEATDAHAVSAAQMARYVGTYRAEGSDSCRVIRMPDGTLGLQLFDRPDTMPIVSTPDGTFTFRYTGGRVQFTPGTTSAALRLDVSIAEVERSYLKVP